MSWLQTVRQTLFTHDVCRQQVCENFFFFLQDLEKQGIFFKAKDDPRISRVGKFLRNSSIDELPQLINILKDDMSLVGSPITFIWSRNAHHRHQSLQAPGTGWTNRTLASEPSGEKKDMSEEERIALDNNYALNHSLY